MKLFKRAKDASLKSVASARIATVVWHQWHKAQQKWSQWMDQKINRLSPKARLTGALSLGIILFAYCLFMIIVAFNGPGTSFTKPTVVIRPIHRFPRNLSMEEMRDSLTSAHIRQFKNYLRSLDSTAAGRLKKQQLLSTRPGLIDSLARIK